MNMVQKYKINATLAVEDIPAHPDSHAYQRNRSCVNQADNTLYLSPLPSWIVVTSRIQIMVVSNYANCLIRIRVSSSVELFVWRGTTEKVAVLRRENFGWLLRVTVWSNLHKHLTTYNVYLPKYRSSLSFLADQVLIWGDDNNSSGDEEWQDKVSYEYPRTHFKVSRDKVGRTLWCWLNDWNTTLTVHILD